jgi:GR25 family glycosyltransferase involved in LPS biosynthesis
MKAMLSNIGLEYNKDVNIVYGSEFPYNQLIMDTFNRAFHPKRCFTKPNEFDCARNHYNIVKTAYNLGCNYLLVLEDDICFIKNTDILYNAIMQLPEDYDVLQFGGFTADPRASTILDEYPNKLWIKHPRIFVWNASMYALSRRGMEYYIKFMDKFFTVADMPLYFAPNNERLINSYITTIPIVIQADKNDVPSDIRSKETDKIDYNTMNVYESRISRSDYFTY